MTLKRVYEKTRVPASLKLYGLAGGIEYLQAELNSALWRFNN
ncbi:MAG: hypothetical protein AMDU4_FER2C00093G0010 [Ferroplasma sp. Type II]|nr:MAG: hypothetical protein AMDU4_FER2C00093G0010 [Ferroplasma sp. Type II]